MSVDLIVGVTRNKSGHVLQAVHTHSKNGADYADTLAFAPDTNDLNDEGKPKVYLIPIISSLGMKQFEGYRND